MGPFYHCELFAQLSGVCIFVDDNAGRDEIVSSYNGEPSATSLEVLSGANVTFNVRFFRPPLLRAFFF